MDNYIFKDLKSSNRKLSFDDWIYLNFDLLNEIIYRIINVLTNDSKKYKFVIDEVTLSNEILEYLYETSYSRFKNELNFIKD
tara:strand:- start:2958 stop:3203 length:246 start_codon:yes stop_codon:yes gene_type:complete